MASSLQDFRMQYPAYKDVPDADLAQAIHGKFYSDMPFSEFSKQIGYKAPRSTLMEIDHDLGWGTRETLKGLASSPVTGGLYDLAAVPFNAAIAGINKLAGTNINQIPSAVAQVDRVMDAANVARAETPSERMVASLNRGGASMLPMMAAGIPMAGSANPVTAGVGATLSAQPVTQVAAGMGGSGGSQAAQELGGGEAAQAAAGIAGSIMAPVATSLASSALSPSVAPAAQRLIDRGVTPTLGHLKDRIAQIKEEFAKGLPGVRASVEGAQEREANSFMRAAVNETLAPIGAKLPAEMIGNKAISEADRIIRDEYKHVFNAIKVAPDPVFQGSIREAAMNLPAELQKTFYKTIDDQKIGTGPLTGEPFKDAIKFFKDEAATYSGDPSVPMKALGSAYAKVATLLRGLIGRADPVNGALLDATDLSYANFMRVMNAAAKNKATGVFSPSQLATAVGTVGGVPATAKGEALMQGIAQDGMNVIGPNAPKSAEPMNLWDALKHPLMTAGAYARWPFYTQGGQNVAVDMMTRRPDTLRNLGGLLSAPPGFAIGEAATNPMLSR